jgi:hypothetical protein
MAQISIGERLAAGAVGAVFGAMIGGAAAWMFGVYSNTMGPGTAAVGFKAWVLLPAAGFGLSGLILGSDVGTMIGAVINAMFEFEKGPENPWPILQLLLAVGLIALGAWWVMG